MAPGKVPHWSEYRAAAGASRFDASLGLLGDQIASHGGCIQAVGPGAALGAARASGMVVRYQQYDRVTLPAALAACLDADRRRSGPRSGRREPPG